MNRLSKRICRKKIDIDKFNVYFSMVSRRTKGTNTLSTLRLLGRSHAFHVADDLPFDHIDDHLGDVGGVVRDALQVFGNIGNSNRPRDVFRVLKHVEEQFVEYLVVQVVHKIVTLAHIEGEVRVFCDECIEAVLEHLLGRLGHTRDVNVRFERGFVQELDGSLADINGQVSHALEVGDDLDGRGDET